MRYLASVLTAVRCHKGTIQVEPISTRRLTRSIFMKRVLPITWTGRVRNTVYFSILDTEWPEVKSALEQKLLSR